MDSTNNYSPFLKPSGADLNNITIDTKMSRETTLLADRVQYWTFIMKVEEFLVDSHKDDMTGLANLETLRRLAKNIFLSYFIHTRRCQFNLQIKNVELRCVNLETAKSEEIDNETVYKKILIVNRDNYLNQENQMYFQATVIAEMQQEDKSFMSSQHG